MTVLQQSLNPYQALGLSRNPFVAEQESGVLPSLWLDRGFSQAPEPGAGKLIQFLGEKGAGKTSHLKHWQQQTGGAYCYYPPSPKRWRFPAVDAIAYWDEADRIPLPILVMSLALAAQRRSTIVIGTHVDLAWVACGLAVTTIAFPPLDATTLMHWVNLRIHAVRLPDEDLGLHLTPEQAAEIVAIVGSSWRDAADQLHMWAAQCARRV
jgi:hypothetical protein